MKNNQNAVLPKKANQTVKGSDRTLRANKSLGKQKKITAQKKGLKSPAW